MAKKFKTVIKVVGSDKEYDDIRDLATILGCNQTDIRRMLKGTYAGRWRHIKLEKIKKQIDGSK